MTARTEVTPDSLPFPPLELAHRVGSLADAADPFEHYEQVGRKTRSAIVDRLPPDWAYSGKRILDFGCGAGRTLRHFVGEAADAELWGCDIDTASIRWMQEQLSPPLRVFVNGSEPPLDQPDGSFDLIWAISVFTHLADSWSRWLLELHRLLKPDGLLFVTFMGRGMSQFIAGEAWNEDNVGMNVLKYGQSWDLGGPMVMHSPWWIEEHWGRAFEILSLDPDGFISEPMLRHGSVLMRKRDETIEPDELERIAPNDPREAQALAHNVKQLHEECSYLRHESAILGREAAVARAESAQKLTTLNNELATANSELVEARGGALDHAKRLLGIEEILAQAQARIFALEEAHDAKSEQIDDLCERVERADGVLSAMKSSLSWRLTSPLRKLKPRR